MSRAATAYVIFPGESLCKRAGPRPRLVAGTQGLDSSSPSSLRRPAPTHLSAYDVFPLCSSLPLTGVHLTDRGTSHLTPLLRTASDSLPTLETTHDTLRRFHSLSGSSKDILRLITHLLHIPRATRPELLPGPLLPLDFLHTCPLLRTFC